MIHYLDTSALVKRYISESGSRSVRDLFRHGKPIAVARIAYAELAAALCRLRRESLLTESARDGILTRLEEDFSALTIVEIRPALMRSTKGLVVRHPLRGYDAVHLAAAMTIAERGIPVTFWCADSALVEAARQEGLRVQVVGS